MPTYSYLCTECAHEFDIHQSFSDDSLSVCPACGGVLRKVFSPIGVTFNGSGFYRTDSRAQPSDTLAAPKKAAESTDTAAKPAKTSPDTASKKSSKKADSSASV